MEIISVSLHDLRKMNNSEALILQGCGGDLKEWVDGINDMLTEIGILQNESRFEKAYSFHNEDLTCLLFPFDDVQLDIGKLAMWRLHTHEQFGGTWLSDYVPNRLGGFVSEKEQKQNEDWQSYGRNRRFRNGDDVMVYLFTGMIIGGIIGLTVGSLAAAFKAAEKEIARLDKEVSDAHKQN